MKKGECRRLGPKGRPYGGSTPRGSQGSALKTTQVFKAENHSPEASDASIPCDIPCAIPIVKVDASTSCDLISCHENVVEILDEKYEQENEMLKQEVERLKEDLHRLKEKGHMEQSQPSQDNPTIMGVKKLEKGSTVTCFKYHKEGHKSYQCKEEKV